MKWVSTFSLFSINLGPILHSLVLSLVIDHKRSILESSNFYFAFYIFFGYQQFELSIFLKEIEIKGCFLLKLCVKYLKLAIQPKRKHFCVDHVAGQTPAGGDTRVGFWPENLLMATKGPFMAIFSHFEALWRPQMAISDPGNGPYPPPRMCPALIQP